MEKASRGGNVKTHRSKAWYFLLLLIPGLLVVGHNNGKAISPQVQEDLSPEVISITENFDSVTAPALPNNWVSTASGALIPFVTTTNNPDSAPNALFVPNPGTVGLSEITSPPVRIGTSNSHMIFRHFYQTEAGFDGGVLEIKIGTGDFQDIVQAGGTFVTGPYNGTISSNLLNPLAGRAAWTGNSQAYIKTDINLPSAALGQIVQFKWRMGSDAVIAATGWRIDEYVVQTSSAANSSAITIPDSGPASLYPSNVTISNQPGSIVNVIVALNNFTHSSPDDVDILLVSPSGRKIVLMSDVGGTTPVNNINLTFQDSAVGFIPDNGPLVSGAHKPTNIGDDESFPAPAPSGPVTGTGMSAFNGSNPNGVWSLYIVDDNGNNAGIVNAGWEMLLTTDLTICSLNLSSNLQVVPITGGSGSFDIIAPFGCDWSATSISSWITITSATTGGGGVQATLTFDVEPNMTGGRNGIIRVTNPGQTRDFGVQQASGCPFALSETAQQYSSAGGPGSVSVTASGVCSWSATTLNNWITINSGTGNGNGMVTFTVASNPTSNPRTGSIEIGARTLSITQAAANAGTTQFDFDGDDKADLSVFRPAVNTWYIQNSSNGSMGAQQFGLAGDKLPTADYDGDGRSDLAVFRQGTWYVLQTLTGVLRTIQWGLASDTVAPADYDGDGKADIAVWRQSNGTWYILQSSNGALRAEQFGTIGDHPLARDYDGDGKADLCVFRPIGNVWYIHRSSDNTLRVEVFGQHGDKLVPADYDGDGKTDIAVWRTGTGTWYLLQSTAGFAAIPFGISTDQVVPADYDGDGKSDVAVMRDGTWYVLQSSNGAVRNEQWGAIGDIAVQSALIVSLF